MITYIQNGNIFDSKMQTLVNPVNCVGVMGKGLALEFKKLYPTMFRWYEDRCGLREFIGGSVLNFSIGNKVIACFATKYHWRNPSRYDYIERGLVAVRSYCKLGQYESVAIPAIGCGLGELQWITVKKFIDDILYGLETPIEVYEPLQK